MAIKKNKIAIILIFSLTAGGSLSSFFREAVIAYFYGATQSVDDFKLAISLPQALFYSLGTLLTGIFLPHVINQGENENVLLKLRSIVLFCFSIAIFGIVFANYYTPFLVKEYSDLELENLVFYTRISWLSLIILSYYFIMRIYFFSEGKRYLAGGANLIVNSSFIAFLYISSIVYNSSSINTLTISFLASCLILIVFYFMFLEPKKDFLKLLSFRSHNKNKTLTVSVYVLIGALLYHLLNVSPRFVDRAYISLQGDGWVSRIEYAYGIFTGLAVSIGTSIIVVYSKFIALNYRNSNFLREITYRIWWGVVIAMLVSLVIFFCSDWIVELAYERGSFVEKDTIIVSGLLKYLVIALPISIVNMVLVQALLGFNIILIMLIVGLIKFLFKVISLELLVNNEFNLSGYGMSNLISEVVVLAVLILIFILKNKRIND